MHHNLWVTIFLHLAGCKAKDVVCNYLKELVQGLKKNISRFCEKVVRKITAAILEPIERFIETVSIALFYSLVVAVLIAFAGAIPRTMARGA